MLSHCLNGVALNIMRVQWRVDVGGGGFGEFNIYIQIFILKNKENEKGENENILIESVYKRGGILHFHCYILKQFKSVGLG